MSNFLNIHYGISSPLPLKFAIMHFIFPFVILFFALTHSVPQQTNSNDGAITIDNFDDDSASNLSPLDTQTGEIDPILAINEECHDANPAKLRSRGQNVNSACPVTDVRKKPRVNRQPPAQSPQWQSQRDFRGRCYEAYPVLMCCSFDEATSKAGTRFTECRPSTLLMIFGYKNA